MVLNRGFSKELNLQRVESMEEQFLESVTSAQIYAYRGWTEEMRISALPGARGELR